MDESHTEDLSSSDILDVSAPRATDTGVPGRSSSDETLNSLHGVDTPGLVSPNEHLHAHVPQVSQTHSSMLNGSVHPQLCPQSHNPYSDSMGGPESMLPSIPVEPIAISSPAIVHKVGTSQPQRSQILDNSKPSGGTQSSIGVRATDPHLQSSVNISNISVVTASAVPLSGSAGFDTIVGGETGVSAASNIQSQHTQTQTATGSRFRVVKLDTNSEPFRKGRWTCTEYYEKEVPHTADALKGLEVAVETEPANTGINPAAQAPYTLQSYHPPSQDFTSPPAIQRLLQGVTQTTSLAYVSPQEVKTAVHMQKTVSQAPGAPQTGVTHLPNVMPQQLTYAVDPHQPQGAYPTQLHTGILAQTTARQPDFIQPTAPFQTQVQPPLSHISTGIPITPSPGVLNQPSVSITQQLAHQGQTALPTQAVFPIGQSPNIPAHPQPQHQPQPQSQPVSLAPTQGTQTMPLTALQADLQPLLAPTSTLTQAPAAVKPLQLEDAQRLLLQHQGLLGLPSFSRVSAAAGRGGTMELGSAAGTLARMGMSAEASAFMAAAAAAGLRTQHADGEDDSSSGASVVAIDNKIEQAMDLVKSHLMYAVREEVEVLKEQIKELIERNSQLEQENNLLKNLASPEQMAQFQAQVQTGSSPNGTSQPPVLGSAGTQQALPSTQNTGTSA